MSSDTNVWVDFSIIEMLNLPFKCPFQFIMFEETIDEELDKRFKLKTQLLELGLKAVPITIDELYMAQTILNNHTNLSNYDAVSLSIAKVRNIPLLTGDLNLRKAAENEGVLVVGTIWVVDYLCSTCLITIEKAKKCFQALYKYKGPEIRLPLNEIKKRIEYCDDLIERGGNYSLIDDKKALK